MVSQKKNTEIIILDETLIDMVFTYLPVRQTKYINKYYYSKYKELEDKSKFIISKYVYRYLKEYEYFQNQEYFLIPKSIWKKFYPMCYRQKHMNLSYMRLLKWYHYNDRSKKNQFKYIINLNNSLNDKFSKYIDLLSIEELNSIGW